jgi:hypothetical protein
MSEVAEPQTLPSPKPYHLSEPFPSLEALRERLADSEMETAHETEVEATQANEDQEALTVLRSANMSDERRALPEGLRSRPLYGSTVIY